MTITQDRLKELLEFNHETGQFIRLTSHTGRWKRGQSAGYVTHQGYVEIGVDGRYYGVHRLAWLYMTGHWPAGQIDHINGIKTDNRACNLRDVTKSVNIQNARHARTNNSIGILGVCWHKAAKSWAAQIQVKGKKLHLGVYKTPHEAHEAYLAAKRQLHPGCTI